MPGENTSSLDELKRLTLGKDVDTLTKPINSPQQKSTQPSRVEADAEAFKEEQRIFTQVSSIKELTGEQNYSVPPELNAPRKEETQTSPQSSAFAKLKSLSAIPLNMDTKKETITSKTINQQAVFQEKIKETTDVNQKTVGMKSNLDDKPIIKQKFEEKKEPIIEKPVQEKTIPTQIKPISSLEERKEMIAAAQTQKTVETKQTQGPPQAQNTKTTQPQKDYSFDWMKEPEIEEPSEEDFEGQKEVPTPKTTPTPQENSLGGQKDILFDWMKEPEAEEPSEEDFPALQEDQKEAQRQIEDELKAMRTPVDEMFKLIEETGRMDMGELSTQINLNYTNVEQIARMFENDGVIEIEYPTSLTKKPVLIIKNPVQSKFAEIPKGEILETYKLEVDHVPAQVSIVLAPGEARPVYAIQMPNIGKYTKRFLYFVKEEVAETMPIELEEIVDPKKSKKLKDRFFNELNAHLSKYFPNTKAELLYMLSGVLLHEMYGLGDIEIVMGDDMLEEVGINSAKTPITIYHRVHGWLKTNLEPGTEEDINNFSAQIGRKVGREITVLNPILDAHLLSGDRVNATLFPISSEGNTLTIRRFARKPWTIIDFLGKAHTMNSEMGAMLWLAMQYEMNILIAGGTASGKTSTLNTLLALVPTYHRIISIEDVREIVLPKYLEWNWVPLVTRSPNPEGLGEVAMLDLMTTSLRMRPDRIIVGEIRRKKEAEVLMEAIETGHSIYSTIHANSGYQVLRRLAEPPINIPLMQIELLDLIVVQYRDRKTNKRRTYEISEIEQTSTGQGLQINTIYKWVPRNDSWERLNKPTKLITLLNLHTGMTEEDLFKEIEDRRQILEWMKRMGLNELDEIGFLVKLFYSDPERIKKYAKQNEPAETILALLEKDQAEKKEE
jgi:flagellar protein FlaI